MYDVTSHRTCICICPDSFVLDQQRIVRIFLVEKVLTKLLGPEKPSGRATWANNRGSNSCEGLRLNNSARM
jgi:hypothetical protein